jgi:hypothetical protein
LDVELNGTGGMYDGLHRDSSPVGRTKIAADVDAVVITVVRVTFVITEFISDSRDWCESFQHFIQKCWRQRVKYTNFLACWNSIYWIFSRIVSKARID